MYFCPSHRQNIRLTCKFPNMQPNMQIWHIWTLIYMTLTQGHMISTIYCPLLLPVILKKNKLHIYPYTWAIVKNVISWPWPWPKVTWYQPYTIPIQCLISERNEFNIYPYTWAVGGNDKSYIFMTFDLANAHIDLKINRLCLLCIPCYSTSYQLSRSYHVEKMWETDMYRQTHKHLDGPQ